MQASEGIEKKPLEQECLYYQIMEVASNNDPEVVPEDSERLIDFLESIEENMVAGKVPRGEKSAAQLEAIRDFEGKSDAHFDLKLPV